MTNAVYPLWKQSIETESDLNNSLNLSGANACFAALVTINGGYIYSPTHQFYPSISPFIQGIPQEITNPSVVNGLFRGDLVTFTNVTGTEVGAIVIFRANAGSNTTWRLVVYLDTGIPAFPLIPNGANIIVGWSPSGIFQI